MARPCIGAAVVLLPSSHRCLWHQLEIEKILDKFRIPSSSWEWTPFQTCGLLLSVAATCPQQSLHVASLTSFDVCERLSYINGSFAFIAKDGSHPPIELHKRVFAQAVTPSWGGFTRNNVTGAPDGVIGNTFLANDQEPDYATVLAALPPITTG